MQQAFDFDVIDLKGSQSPKEVILRELIVVEVNTRMRELLSRQ